MPVLNSIISPVIKDIITDVISVPAATGFLPPDISGLIFWVDADDDSTISGNVIGPGDITEVGQWNDKSGFDKNVIQDGFNPILFPLSNLNNINGKNVIAFDGQGNHLFFIDLATPVLVSGSDAATIFGVSRIVGDSSASAINTLFSFGPNNPLGGQVRGLDINSDSNLSGYQFNNGDRLFNGNPWGTSAKVSTWTWADGATYNQGDLYVNGILQVQNSSNNGTFVPNIIDDQILLGAMRTLLGFLTNMGKIDIGEIFVYDRQLTTDEREAAESYLTDKWSIS